eukprot:GDKJ01022771.1.p1 GENE.GDKJ01022771.1~~GDKJ01022771.1.p1  ORF type:complete len:583 (+),score=100.84 GDKJ01022771.1:139-1887(+)
MRALYPLLLGSAAALESTNLSCSAVIRGHMYNLEPLKGRRFEFPGREGDKVIFSVCDEVDASGGVAYLLNNSGNRTILGSIYTGHSWRPITEPDEDDNVDRFIGAEVTYFGEKDDRSYGSQWHFRLRALCSFDVSNPVLRSFNMNYPNKIATAELASVHACPTKVWSPQNFFSRNATIVSAAVLVSALILGLSSGVTLQTFSCFSGFIFGGILSAFLASILLFGEGVPVSEDPNDVGRVSFFLRTASAFVLAIAGAVTGAILFGIKPKLGLILGGMIAAGGIVAMLTGVFHFIWRLMFGKLTVSIMETVIIGSACILGAIWACRLRQKAVPLLACLMGAYLFTAVLGEWVGSFPRQSDLKNFVMFIFGVAKFNPKDGHIEPAGARGPYNLWYPVRGKQSFFAALGYFFIFSFMSLFFIFVHVNAYNGYRTARDVPLNEDGSFYQRLPNTQGEETYGTSTMERLREWLKEHTRASALIPPETSADEKRHHHRHHHHHSPQAFKYFENVPGSLGGPTTPLLGRDRSTSAEVSPSHVPEKRNKDESEITPKRFDSTRAATLIEEGNLPTSPPSLDIPNRSKHNKK